MDPMIVILAGGEGSRMGGGKPLRMLGGETLVQRALMRARGWSSDVRIALRSADQAPGLDAPALMDDPEVWGPLAGLASAFAAAREAGRSHMLTLPCDMPFLPDDLVERMRQEIGETRAALAVSDGQLHPVCALWSVEAGEKVEAYREAGRRSLKGLAETVGFVAVEWPAGTFSNVNTPGELADAERRLASEIQHRNR